MGLCAVCAHAWRKTPRAAPSGTGGAVEVRMGPRKRISPALPLGPGPRESRWLERVPGPSLHKPHTQPQTQVRGRCQSEAGVWLQGFWLNQTFTLLLHLPRNIRPNLRQPVSGGARRQLTFLRIIGSPRDQRTLPPASAAGQDSRVSQGLLCSTHSLTGRGPE